MEKHHRAFGFLGASVAIIITAIYLKIVPVEAAATGGAQEIILRYGHSLCWILLSQASLLWGVKKTNKWSKFLAYVALVVYIIFMGTLFITYFN